MIKVQKVLTVQKVVVKQETVQSEKLIQHLIQKKLRNKKRQKKKKKRKTPKGASDKGKQNGSAPAKPTNDQPKEDTLDAFLKRKDLTKWYDFIDMLSPEDIEAIDIIITQRRNEGEEDLAKEMKKEQEDEKPVLKDGKQTDGSCDRTTGSGTDATDPEEGKHKKRIRRKLNKEFIVYVGEEKKKMRLVECTDSNSLSETTQSEEEAIDSQIWEVQQTQTRKTMLQIQTRKKVIKSQTQKKVKRVTQTRQEVTKVTKW